MRPSERKAVEASQAVAWNEISLGHHGVINQEQVRLTDWVLVRAWCPDCGDLHWLAYGFNDSTKRFEIFSNSRRGGADHPAERGWKVTRCDLPWIGIAAGALPFPVPLVLMVGPARYLWCAPVLDGGWVVERFNDLQHPQCNLALQLGLARKVAKVTFTFTGPVASVGLLDDEDTRSNPEANPAGLLQYYAVEAEFLPPRGAIPAQWQRFHEAFLDHVVASGEAADLAVRILSGEGRSLGSVSKLRPVRLPEGRTLVLGVYDPSRQENRWWAVWIDQSVGLRVATDEEMAVAGWLHSPHLRQAEYKVTIAGHDVRMLVEEDRDRPGRGVEFLFLELD